MDNAKGILPIICQSIYTKGIIVFSKIKLGTKLLCFIAPILIVVMGIVFTWVIKREENLIREEIRKKTEVLAQKIGDCSRIHCGQAGHNQYGS